MELTVLVEKDGANGYTARDPFGRSAAGRTADEAVANLQTVLTTAGGHVARIQLPPHPTHEWIGIFKDNPMFDEWSAAIEENRRIQDAEDAARLAAEAESERR
jgi:predicted RNase H-like HicB family nuclease